MAMTKRFKKLPKAAKRAAFAAMDEKSIPLRNTTKNRIGLKQAGVPFDRQSKATLVVYGKKSQRGIYLSSSEFIKDLNK